MDEMNEFEESLHRTLVQFLVVSNQRELAAATIDGQVKQRYDQRGNIDGFYLDVPVSAYLLIAADQKLQDTLRRAFRAVVTGHQPPVAGDDIAVEIRMKLMPVENGWQEVVRDEITKSKGSNQGLVSELLAAKNGRPVITYNELRYASNSEVRIAQEFERRKVLFFPLTVGIRADTGTSYKDHREVDFLVCQDGVWGILEVAYHPDRYEQDKEKDAWFKKSGILCIEHYTSERCYNASKEVVQEFLSHLARYK
jgi:hypothetical protein